MFLGDIDKEEIVNKKEPIKGENIDTEIQVSLEDAFYGLEKKDFIKNNRRKNENI